PLRPGQALPRLPSHRRRLGRDRQDRRVSPRNVSIVATAETFDRLLIAEAQLEHLAILSADEHFARCDVDFVQRRRAMANAMSAAGSAGEARRRPRGVLPFHLTRSWLAPTLSAMTSRTAGASLLSLFAAAALSGCSGAGTKAGTTPAVPPAPPAVPAKLEADTLAPTAGNDPSAKSKLIDLMAAQNTRWGSAQKTARPAPAHSSAYQSDERRFVVMDAVDGVLLADEDEPQRALDVEVRVGSNEIDSRHTLRDPRLAAFTSMARLGQ